MRKAAAIALAALASLLAAPAAHACAVCYGAPDSAETAAVNQAILFLLGVVVLVQGGLVALFVSIVRRSRAYHRRKAELHLIEGGAR